jgi:hypothetical protein
VQGAVVSSARRAVVSRGGVCQAIPPNPYVELPMNWLDRDLHLVLLLHIGLLDLPAAALRAGGRQWSLVRLVDLRRNWAAMMRAMVRSASAAGLLRLGFGGPLENGAA